MLPPNSTKDPKWTEHTAQLTEPLTHSQIVVKTTLEPTHTTTKHVNTQYALPCINQNHLDNFIVLVRPLIQYTKQTMLLLRHFDLRVLFII